MTYCVALRLNEGLVFLSDTRTNAGVDNISSFSKMFTWSVPGERAMVMLTSGNLSITQGVMNLLQENIDLQKEGVPTILAVESMFEVAEVVASAMKEVQTKYGPGLSARGEASDASIVVGGQRQGGVPRLFLIYSAGNFIEATDDTSFFQIGEIKYGKPILDRTLTVDMPLEAASTLAFLSMDSTLRSNLSVGMPLDLAVIARDQFQLTQYRRIGDDDERFRALSNAWSTKLREAFYEISTMPV